MAVALAEAGPVPAHPLRRLAALLGRNKAVGILLAGLLFGGLQVGTSSRQLDPSIFDPALATDLATMIQALVIFFVVFELLRRLTVTSLVWKVTVGLT